MPRTANIKNLDEAFLYAIRNPYVGNGLINTFTVKYMQLAYDTGIGGVPVVGLTVVGAGGATGIVIAFDGNATSGTLTLDQITGTFVDGEQLLDSGDGGTFDADVNGLPLPYVSETLRNAGDVFTQADLEVVVRCVRSVNGKASSVITIAREITYDSQTVNYTVGKHILGGTSGATALISAVKDDGVTGTLTLSEVVGTFQNPETIGESDGSGNGSSTSLLVDRQATFTVGTPPDEAAVVVTAGAGLSDLFLTGGKAGDTYEILRGRPTYGTSDYVGYVTGKTGEEGDPKIVIRDKGIIQHRKNRGDVERTLSVNTRYLNDLAGLSQLVDQDAILVFEREEDRDGTATELTYYLQARQDAKAGPNESEGSDSSDTSFQMRFERAYSLAG